MTWQVIWLFAAPAVAGLGIVAIAFATIHADEARSRKKNKATDA